MIEITIYQTVSFTGGVRLLFEKKASFPEIPARGSQIWFKGFDEPLEAGRAYFDPEGEDGVEINMTEIMSADGHSEWRRELEANGWKVTEL